MPKNTVQDRRDGSEQELGCVRDDASTFIDEMSLSEQLTETLLRIDDLEKFFSRADEAASRSSG